MYITNPTCYSMAKSIVLLVDDGGPYFEGEYMCYAALMKQILQNGNEAYCKPIKLELCLSGVICLNSCTLNQGKMVGSSLY